MMKLRNITALAAALLLALTLCVPAFGETPSWGDLAMDVAVAQRAERGIADNQPLLTEDAFPAGSSVSDWTALAMARAGIADDYAGYLARLQAYVERQYAENGGLHAVKATEYHRIALTAAALGGDPAAFGAKPDGTAIDLVAEGTYNWQGEEDLGGQGLNGWIFALLTIDAVGAEVPADARYSRQDMLDAIVSAQLPDGGFSLGGGAMDVDITAMALQALAPYREQYQEVIDAAAGQKRQHDTAQGDHHQRRAHGQRRRGPGQHVPQRGTGQTRQPHKQSRHGHFSCTWGIFTVFTISAVTSAADRRCRRALALSTRRWQHTSSNTAATSSGIT